MVTSELKRKPVVIVQRWKKKIEGKKRDRAQSDVYLVLFFFSLSSSLVISNRWWLFHWCGRCLDSMKRCPLNRRKLTVVFHLNIILLFKIRWSWVLVQKSSKWTMNSIFLRVIVRYTHLCCLNAEEKKLFIFSYLSLFVNDIHFIGFLLLLTVWVNFTHFYSLYGY